MWIPCYIDMNPHFSQNILNKGTFQMWIHHYIDMNPHESKHIKVVYLKNVDTPLYRHVSTLPGHQIQKGGYVVYPLNVDTSLYRHESTF